MASLLPKSEPLRNPSGMRIRGSLFGRVPAPGALGVKVGGRFGERMYKSVYSSVVRITRLEQIFVNGT